MAMKADLGTILTLNGTAITTTYGAPQTSAIINGGRCDNLRVTVKSTTIGGSSITSIKAKVSTSRDGVTYEDVSSTIDAGTLAVEQTFTIGAAGTAQENYLTLPGNALYIKVQVKSVGGAGQVGESIAIGAQAY